MNEYYGYTLFNEIEDPALRTRNRAVILANIMEQNTKHQKISRKGAALALGYFNQIPDEEKQIVHDALTQQLKERGYVERNSH